MDIILIPGFWLDGSSWDEVVPALGAAGHRTHAVTLPGMESKGADRSKITLRDHVDAVVGVIDSLDPAGGQVVLVGHSGGGAVAHAAVDARPDGVARVVYVGSGPLGEGGIINDEFPTANGEIPLPTGTSSMTRTSSTLMTACARRSVSARSRRPSTSRRPAAVVR